jgi:hypothetical protein
LEWRNELAPPMTTTVERLCSRHSRCTCIYTYMCICMYIHAHTHVRVRVCACALVHAYVIERYVHACVIEHTYLRTS